MTDSDEVKLLPCPFCGGEPISFASGAGDGLMIQCINDKCGVEPHCSYIPPEAAIAAWNTRPPVVTDEVVERVAPIVARALAKRHGLGDHMPCDAWMKEARVATRTALEALASMPAVVSGGHDE